MLSDLQNREQGSPEYQQAEAAVDRPPDLAVIEFLCAVGYVDKLQGNISKQVGDRDQTKEPGLKKAILGSINSTGEKHQAIGQRQEERSGIEYRLTGSGQRALPLSDQHIGWQGSVHIEKQCHRGQQRKKPNCLKNLNDHIPNQKSGAR